MLSTHFPISQLSFVHCARQNDIVANLGREFEFEFAQAYTLPDIHLDDSPYHQLVLRNHSIDPFIQHFYPE